MYNNNTYISHIYIYILKMCTTMFVWICLCVQVPYLSNIMYTTQVFGPGTAPLRTKAFISPAPVVSRADAGFAWGSYPQTRNAHHRLVGNGGGCKSRELYGILLYGLVAEDTLQGRVLEGHLDSMLRPCRFSHCCRGAGQNIIDMLLDLSSHLPFFQSQNSPKEFKYQYGTHIGHNVMI